MRFTMLTIGIITLLSPLSITFADLGSNLSKNSAFSIFTNDSAEGITKRESIAKKNDDSRTNQQKKLSNNHKKTSKIESDSLIEHQSNSDRSKQLFKDAKYEKFEEQNDVPIGNME